MHGYFRRFIHCCGVFGEMFHSTLQIVYGSWRVSVLPRPIVTIFGGSRWPLESQYAQQASKLAQMLVENKISVLHGGGPGIMEAVSRGAIKQDNVKGMTMGIGVRGLEDRNPAIKDYFELNFFFARKWLLTRYSVGFIVFPGGFGTLDELCEVLTLVQTKKLTRVPIILVGKDYWQPFVQWIHNEMMQYGLIAPEHKDLFIVKDDLESVLSLVCETCKLVPQEPIKKV